nr:hypothetical protein [Thermoflexibacter sp.]
MKHIRINSFALLFILLAHGLVAQQPKTHEKTKYVDEQGRYFQHVSLPLFLFLSTSAEGDEKVRLQTTTKNAHQNAFYLDGHGKHFIRHPITQGKEAGESALLRSMMSSLDSGDIAVMDRYYCSFMMIALLLSQGVQTCARKHHLRHSDFRRGKRLGKYDHVILWTRPQRPKWMDQETYDKIPETLELREIRFHIIVPGRRTQS